MRTVFVLALVLTLVGCQDEKKSAAASKAAREAIQREQKARRESDERKARLRTIRVVGFIVLSSGAVAVLVFTGRPPTSSHIVPMTPEWRDRIGQTPMRRIIEVNPPPERGNNRRRS